MRGSDKSLLESSGIDSLLDKDIEKTWKNITDEEAMALSAYYLSGENSKSIISSIFPSFSERKIRNMAKRGLFELDLKDIVSYYPLFGDEREAKWALHLDDIVKCIISLIENMELYLNEKRLYGYFSTSEYFSFFPSLDKDVLLNLTKKVLKNLEELEIIKKEKKGFTLDRKRALEFIFLDEIRLASYIIWPKLDCWVRENSFYFLSLLKKIKRAKEEDAEKYVLRAAMISSFSSFSIEDLYDFLILTKEDGLVFSQKDEVLENPANILSDYTVSIFGPAPALLSIFAIPKKIERIKTFCITKESILNAFLNGYNAKDIIPFLESLSSKSIPKSLIERIEIWQEEYKRISIRRALVLKADSKSASLIKQIPTIKDYIIEEIAENVFIMDGIREQEWRSALKNASFDMLAETEGPEFNFCRYEIESSPFLEYKLRKEINDERIIKYDSSYKDYLLSIAKNVKEPLERAVWIQIISSGIIIREEFSKVPFPFLVRDAFNYMDKHNMIEEALKNKSLALFVENHRGSIALGKVQMAESFEEGDHMILSHKMLKISRLYKVTAIPDDLL